MNEEHVPVLIVGGSLVGLSTSALLASQGVQNMVVERHRGTAIHPRAASFHQRTMEIYRSVGLQQEVEAAAAKEFVQNGAIISVESLCGKELQYFYRSFNDGVEGLSPTSRLFITQIGLEPLLRGRAEDLGADHRYSTELVSFDQDEAGVHAVIRPRDGGPEQLVHAEYLVGADGAHSVVRQGLGISMDGRGSFSDCITIYFKADLRQLIGDRNLSVVYVNHPELLGFFRFSITGDSGFLAVFSTTSADGTRDSNVGENIDPARCVDYVRTALGCDSSLPVQIEHIQRWSASAAYAEHLQSSRVFLVGDAAHVMPPTGGFGGNTGIGDAHNLAWKLAMVLAGIASPELLTSYETERRPIDELTVEQAYTRYVLRVDPSLPRDNLAAPLDDAAIELGSIYRSNAVVGDPVADESLLDDPRNPVGRLGTRAAHLRLDRAGTALSTHDLFGPGFTLLTGVDGAAWCEAAAAVAANLRVPLVSYRVGAGQTELVDVDGRFGQAFGVGRGGAVIVRPDGVLAWRGERSTTECGAALEAAMLRLLARTA